jgi:hypothetical protein
MEVKISPDERITMNALDNFDPFARNGVPTQPVNQPKVAKKPGRKPKEEVTEQNEDRNVDIGTQNETKPLETIENAVPEPQIEEELHKTLTLQQPIVESRSSEGLPSYRTEFAGRDIFVGFSAVKQTNPITAFSMINMALDFGRDKIRFDFATTGNFYHGKNELAKKFLQTDAKYLLLIDNDIVPSIGRPAWAKSTIGAAQNVQDSALQRHVIHRLIGSGKSIIGAAYFENQLADSIVCSNKDLGSKAKSYPEEIVPVDWTGSGCMLIHRRVFADIGERQGGFFFPDDISFCKRAKDAGHQPHIDLGIPVFHVGYKSY